MTTEAASLGIQPWDQGTETFSEWTKRRDKAVQEQRDERRRRELFRLALVHLPIRRYAVGVEFGMDAERGEPGVHAYAVCKECYRTTPGLVDPRVIVMDDRIKQVVPDNEVLAVGADMMEIISAMMDHEQRVHGGRPR